MGLLDDLGKPAEVIFRCRVRTVLGELDEADRDKLQEAINNEKWTANKLSSALKAKGIQLGQDAIRNHRLKGCSCSKI